ncbi:MAG: ABC-F type ribosomal protection protein [Oscillospiraceae bacterium]|nr:ABC-F type ribosomal protection protein [Oscillospiraceae bacterium]
MALISVSNLTFAYEGSYDNIFENVGFQLDTDWKLGFTGRNGRGKTTFLNLLLGNYNYNGIISSPCGFEYFPFEIKNQKIPVSNIIENICPDFLEWELMREFSMLELEPGEEILRRSFETLSYGEQTKVLLAALFLKQNRFLLIDEPTNHLDIRGREVVAGYLKGKKGFILVSHDRAFLDGCIDHVLSINKNNIEVQKGNFSSWLINKERRDNFELAENIKLKKEVKRLEKSAREKAEWANRTEASKIGAYDKGYIGHKAAKMMKRSKVIESRQKTAIEEKSKLLKNIETSESLKINQRDYHSGRFVNLDGVSIYYGDKIICKDISFTVNKGDRIALKGRNGSGKSSVIKLICGEDIKYTGGFHKGPRLAISYVSQDTSYLTGSLGEYIKDNNLDESLFKAILRKLDFLRIQFEKDLTDFSGGQKKKVLIAKSLCEKSHLLVWDEPLNYIDVISRMQIEDLLLEYKPTVLFVEHDVTFCENIATKTVELF